MDAGSRRRLAGAWHVLGLACVLFVPAGLRFGELPWRLPREHALVVAGLAICYLLAAAILCLTERGRSRDGAGGGQGPVLDLLVPVLLSLAVLAGLFLVLLLADATHSRSLLLLGTAAVVALIPVPTLLGRMRRRPRTSYLLAGAGAVILALVALRLAVRTPSATFGEGEGVAEARTPSVTSSVVPTLRGPVEVRLYENYLPASTVGAGAVEPLDDGYLLVTGDGAFFRLSLDPRSGTLDVGPLPFRAPLEREAFDVDAPPAANRDWFRVDDLLVRSTEDGARVLVTHHVWHSARDCYALRLSAADLPAGALDPVRAPDRPRASDLPPVASGTGVATWRAVYETRPCLPLNRSGWGNAFPGHQGGGRLAALADGRLLLTVGDYEFDGWNRSPAMPQDDSTDYGKTLIVDPVGGTARTFTRGHRNAQGLEVDRRGRIWSTEHGPKGGDELNLLVPDGNYGWPLQTLGANYDDVVWPLQTEAGEAEGFRPPVYALVPSIGISNLLALRRGVFSDWRDDLLVASLAAQTLYRLRLEGERVAYAEPIEVGVRIRDLAEGPEGRLLLLGDEGEILSVGRPGAAAEGAALFAACTGCHVAEGSGIGPPLAGVYGRPVAASPGFDYSDALRSKGGRWTEGRLHAYLTAPDSFAPGTRMRVVGIADSARRAALIDHLKRR